MTIASSSLYTVATLALLAGAAACLVACSSTAKPQPANVKGQSGGLVITALNQTIKICDIQPGTYQPINCNPTCVESSPVLPNTETPPCAVSASVPKVVQVTRGTAPIDAGYLLYMGPIVVGSETTAGRVLIDTYDTPVFTNEQRLASSSLVTGWSMTLRNRPYPPGRSGRFTSGRPRYFPGVYATGPEISLPLPLRNVYPPTCTPLGNTDPYATLCIVNPTSTATEGEYWVMVRDMAEDDRLAMFAHDGTTVDLNKYACLTHETYAVFTWSASNPSGTWSAVQPLPSLGWLQTNKPFAHFAITACYQNSGKRFFAED
jgi:hypothetical protein